MAQPLGMATAFGAAVDCVKYVHLGQNLKRDYQTEQVSLNCARLRLSRWGKAVNILGDPQLGRKDATPAELDAVKDTLQQIIVLFDDAEKISKKYDSDSPFRGSPSEVPEVTALNNMIDATVDKRSKGPGLVRTASWALYRREELMDLVSGVTRLIDDVERLFPSPMARRELAQLEAAEIRDKKTLELLEKVSHGVDKLLWEETGKALVGHQYNKVIIEGKAHTGDMVAKKWEGKAVGPSHTYNFVDVKKTGKALVGNSYGGKDFWDSD